MNYICPICGCPELERDPEGLASFEICPSCSFQFRVTDDDRGFTYEEWRKQWIAKEMIWDKGRSEPPEGWDLMKRLMNIK